MSVSPDIYKYISVPWKISRVKYCSRATKTKHLDISDLRSTWDPTSMTKNRIFNFLYS